LSSTNKSALKQTVLGAKYLIYDPFKNQEQINIYSWKANHSFNWHQLIPAVSVFAGAIYMNNLIIFSLCQYFTKSHADYSKSSG
jgi:hypothetical protein